jgi:hypothetical protein
MNQIRLVLLPPDLFLDLDLDGGAVHDFGSGNAIVKHQANLLARVQRNAVHSALNDHNAVFAFVNVNRLILGRRFHHHRLSRVHLTEEQEEQEKTANKHFSNLVLDGPLGAVQLAARRLGRLSSSNFGFLFFRPIKNKTRKKTPSKKTGLTFSSTFPLIFLSLLVSERATF